MDSAPVSNHGEERVVKAEAITGPTLQQQHGARDYAETALIQSGNRPLRQLLGYGSIIKMIEYLRHRNPDCAKTIIGYLGHMKTTFKALNNITPDQLVRSSLEANEDQLEALFLDLDDHWLEAANSTTTRLTKWAILKTFLVANHVRKASAIKCNIRARHKIVDFALTREDCRKILDTAQDTEDKLAVALLIESLQRIGTISLLTWGDMLPHLEKNEDVFLVWIDPLRTKCNIEHWMPVGPLSSYYLRKRLAELKENINNSKIGNTNISEARLITATQTALMMRLHRIILQAGVQGKKQGSGHTTRYEKHIHSFRKFGVVEMQNKGVNEQVIRFLMGQKRDTYTEWKNRYDDLLKIYRDTRPALDQGDTLKDIVEYARSRGYSLDPKAPKLIRNADKSGDIGADTGPHPGNSQGAEAPGAFEMLTELFNVIV